MMPLLRIENLVVKDLRTRRLLLDGITFSLQKGEILGILGESGSGKSLTTLCILKLLPPRLIISSGVILFEGKDILSLLEEEMQKLRGKEVAIILQDPLSSLNPVLTIGQQITEVLWHHLGLSKDEAWTRGVELLREVGIPYPELRMKSYPHELSGGMRQRAMIAMALACQPKLLIADEPTTALDPTLQFQILVLLKKLNQEKGLTILFISHDLGVIRYIADRTIVYHQGRIVEEAKTSELFTNPLHPYTLQLLASYPDSPWADHLYASATRSNSEKWPTTAGCLYFPHCAKRMARCLDQKPNFIKISETRGVSCHLYA